MKSTKAVKAPMNLLIIAVDTLRACHLGAYGFKKPTSPNIDALLAQSVQFDEAMSTAPWTLPSFATMMTSQYTSTHGAWRFTDTLDASFPTLAEQYLAAGYHTAAVVGHIFLGTKFGLAQGFTEYEESLVLETLGESHKAITSHHITDKSIAFLDRHKAERPGKPWLLWTHYFDPHNKYLAHEGITEIFGPRRKDHYHGEIAYTDRHIGRLLAHLKRTGMDDNTVIVFVSDHGEEFMDHGAIHHGKTLFREVIRVPMAIRVPGSEPRRVKQLVGTIDLMPTLLELMDIPPPDIAMSGQSLAPLFRGEAVPTRPVLMETFQNKAQDASLKGIVTPKWKLIIETPYEEGEGKTVTRLYQWTKDKREKKNLAQKKPEKVTALNSQLEALIATATTHKTNYALGQKTEHSAEETRQLELLGYIDTPNE